MTGSAFSDTPCGCAPLRAPRRLYESRTHPYILAVGENSQRLVAHQESGCSEMYFRPVPLEQGKVSRTTLCWPLNYCHVDKESSWAVGKWASSCNRKKCLFVIAGSAFRDLEGNINPARQKIERCSPPPPQRKLKELRKKTGKWGRRQLARIELPFCGLFVPEEGGKLPGARDPTSLSGTSLFLVFLSLQFLSV